MHDFEEKQKKLNSDIANLLKTKSEHETTLEEAMASHQLCTSSQPDVLKLDSALAELKKNERELNALTNQLDHSGGKCTMKPFASCQDLPFFSSICCDKIGAFSHRTWGRSE